MTRAARAWAYRVALLGLRGWWLVRRPRSAGVRCVLRRGDEVLLVRHTYGDRGWMLPGGRVRIGEHPLAAARREMADELGVEATGWHVVGAIGARHGYRRERPDDSFRRHTTYYAHAEVTTMGAPREGELSAAQWFAADALPADASVGEARDAGLM